MWCSYRIASTNFPATTSAAWPAAWDALHDYYKIRKDFWESSALAAGPVFALGTGQLSPEEMQEEEAG